MIRRLAFGVLILMMVVNSAAAEVYFGLEPPEDWAEKDCLRLTFIDAGRSDAMLLENAGRSMLIDGGDGQYTRQIRQLVEEHNVKKLDAMLNSHPHNDHIHGLAQLVRDGLMADVFYSQAKRDYPSTWQRDALRALSSAVIPYAQIEDGDELCIGHVIIHVMRYPGANGANDRSAVLQLVFDDSTALLPGDISYVAMGWLLENEPPEYLRGDVLKVPHHGITGITEPFLDAVSPMAACVTNTRERAKRGVSGARKRGITLFYTPEGCVEAVTDGADWYIRQLKDKWN